MLVTHQQTVVAAFMVVLSSVLLNAQAHADAQEVASRTEHIGTVQFTDRIRGEERAIFVPENRRDSRSREISVFYLRIPAQADVGLPPLVILPGGPGQSITCDNIAPCIGRTEYSLYSEIAAYSEVRDFLIINQRGVSGTRGEPGLPKYWTVEPPDVSKPLSFEESAERLSRALIKAIEQCEDRDFDVRGYDISHLVDDVEAIRIAHGYRRFAFRAASFGSQWALAYLSRYPSNVDRLVLSGVEPVDYGYDSADGIWNVIKRVEAEARQEEYLVLPEVGLAEAVKAIVARLETNPARVRGYHPRKGYTADVLIGPDDFRHYLLRPILDSQPHSRKMLALWPKFVAETYAEDYQYLAAKIIDDRPETAFHGLLLTLVDNSIGISAERAASLNSEQARRWLGDVNWFYTSTRPVCPKTPFVEDVRRMAESPVPVLLVQGTFDVATPLENAIDLIRFFPNGKLLTVTGGTHAATYHAAGVDKKFLSYLTAFMNTPDAVRALGRVPEEIRLPPLKFEGTGGPSLFKMLIEIEEKQGRTRHERGAANVAFPNWLINRGGPVIAFRSATE